MRKFDQINMNLSNELGSVYDKAIRIKDVVNRLDGGIPEKQSDPSGKNITVEAYSIIEQQEALIRSVAEINSILEGVSARLESIA